MMRNKNTFSPPGTAIYTGVRHDIDPLVNYVAFNKTDYDEDLKMSSDVFLLKENNPHFVQWYDIRGLHNIELIDAIAAEYKMHALSVENAVDVNQRPIFMEVDDGLFISFKYIHISEDIMVVRQNVSLYFGDGFVLSFQEDEDDLFSNIRDRIKSKKGRIRNKGADYLAYTILDYCVDRYFGVLDIIEESISVMELAISEDVDYIDKSTIYIKKKELLKIRKAIVPMREAIGQISRSDSDLINESTMTFLRDVHDHAIQLMDNVDSLRDVLSGLQDLYISEVSLKMNRVMQFLTIITAIFVPLSFLTGLYGMNFEYIPELKIANGYFILIVVMVIMTVGMLLYFKKKKWL